MEFKYYGQTDQGLKRTINEDYFGVNENLGLILVADGMGGHNAGEVASKTAVETITKFIQRCSEDKDFTWPYGFNPNLSEAENRLLTGVRLANREVCNLASEKKEFSGMGTTIVGALINNNKITIAHVGDSRAYRIQNKKIEQLTVDHSWVSEQMQKKLITEDEAKNHRWKNVITRALGNKLDIEVDLKTFDIVSGDIFLFCTDGLSGMIMNEDILNIIESSKDNLKTATEILIKKSNDAGGLDNITLVILCFPEKSENKPDTIIDKEKS